MESESDKNNVDDRSESESKDSSIVFIKEGDLCPNCGFAALKREPGNIIRCPICNYGNGAGCT